LGGQVFGTVCGQCHAGAGPARAPGYTALSGMSPRAIVDALEEGRMQVHGDELSDEERVAVAQWLTGRMLVETPLPDAAYCASSDEVTGAEAVHWSGWGGNPEATGFRTTGQAGLTVEDLPQLRLKWAFGFPDAVQVRSKPAVVGDRILVGSQFGEVYSLDLETGCAHWVFAAGAAVRGGIVIGEGPDRRQSAFFADFRTDVYALDAATGELLWTTRVGSHPEASNTGTVALHDGRVYVPVSSMEVATAGNPEYECCTSSGEVIALEVASGVEVWRHRAIREEPREVGTNAAGARTFAPSGAPVWSSPTVDVQRGLLYVGTGENYTRPSTEYSDAILALDLLTGELAWSYQGTSDDSWNLSCGSPQDENCPDPIGPDVDFGMAPVLVTEPGGKEILVAGQKSGVVWALDPDTDGEVLWATKVGKGSALGGVHWGLASDGERVYAPNSDTPAGMMGIEPDFPASPGLYALDLGSGEVLWSAPADPSACANREGCVPALSAAPTAIPGAVLSGSLDGHLRAYSTEDGSVLWDFDTVREFETANGIPGRGGALDGPGPVVSRGMLLVNSGYGLFGQISGNVLLAFEVER
jgi:polyvinyl alcohol dehydrogenase (cytochrome)